MTKKNIIPVVVLSVICLVVAALLAGVNMLTKAKIASDEAEKLKETLGIVLPEAESFEEIELNDSYPEEIKSAYKSDAGYVFETETRGKELLTIVCGIDNDGNLVKLDVVKEGETPGYKEKVLPNVTGDSGVYNGKNSETLEPEIYSGATMTSNGVYKAVKAALDAYTVLKGGELEPEPENPLAKSEEEILSLAATLIPEAKGFTKAELEGEYKNLISVYKEDGGLGYLAYVLVISEYYGTVESEALIHIGNDGKIKNINKLTWKTSDAWGDFVPPADDAVNAFYDRFSGENSSSIDSVELISGATNTSSGVRNSVKEALTEVEKLIALDMPTPEDELITLAGELVGGEADLESVDFDDAKYVKRIYKDKGGKGYVAYVVVLSEYYGTVESEALIHIGNDGKIKNINKLTWKTSDAWGDFVPPTEDAVNAFYDRIPGNNSASIDSLELISGATNTSSGVRNSVKEALTEVEKLIKLDMPTSEAELIGFAKALVGDGADFESIDFGEAKHLKRIYKDKGGKGYVAYVVVLSEYYGTVETENLIYIDADGIIKGIKRITWKTSDAWGDFVPPTKEKVNEFYDGFVGSNSASIDSVELISGATNTTSGVVNSVKEALEIVDEDITKSRFDENNTVRIIGISILSVSVALFVTVVIVLKKKRGGRS